MIMHPAIIALTVGSLLVSFIVVLAAYHGVAIIRRWDLRSGSEFQLQLERRTYLVSTLMSYALCFQLFSLFLFIFTTDRLSHLFVGAMCAAGTLNVNGCGYPVLLLKTLNFILGGVWLIINAVDNQAVDYPLIKKKYLFLLLIAPLIVGEMVLQGGYFFRLDAHVITSCCGSLFNADGKNAGAVFAALPIASMKMTFFLTTLLAVLSGLLFYARGNAAAGILFSLMSVVSFVVSVAALISFISVYIYQLPTHHCPFCVLQGEYGYVGYPLYLCLLGSVVAGVAVGALMPARKLESLQKRLPTSQKRLALAAIASQILFTAIVVFKMVFTNFKMD